MLVRYKNGLLDPQRTADACVELIMGSNIEGFRNPVLRGIHPILKRRSFRLTKAYEMFLSAYVTWKIRTRVSSLLDDFSSRQLTCQAKDALREVMHGVATIEYK